MKPSLQDEEDRLTARLVWRIMPLIALAYFVSVIDKSNVGFAKLQMLDDLKMTEAAFGFGASMFFVAMLMFELPSSLFARRFGLPFWTARIMISWGLITLSMIYVSSPSMFYALRFLLGVAEAGLYPAILFYLACWFPHRHKARATGFLTLGSAFGNGLGAAMSGPLLDLDGVGGMAGWQWLFLITGILPLVTAVVVWRLLPNRIEDATFLSQHERNVLRSAVERDMPPLAQGKHFMTLLWDPRACGLAVVFIVILTALFGVIYWLPTLVKAFDVNGTTTGLVSAVPWTLVALALLTIPPLLKTPRQVSLAMAVLAAVGSLLFFAGTIATTQPWLQFLCIAFGTPCISLLITCFWTIPMRRFSGVHAAAALAVISTYGNAGGFFAQNLMPWAARVTGTAAGAMYVPTACLALIATGALASMMRSSARVATQDFSR